MTNTEVSESGLKLFNENKIDEWAATVAADDITFEDMAIGHKASGRKSLQHMFKVGKRHLQTW